ncbi:MAG: Sec-independent protein translocase protein TatB [Alphaproteobacteria bacterium]|uniref:Sec-independent protein translocase protein TatB n=1 Tax=Brevundimonas sp. TaxID=1871086 RepID=UPI0017D41668|nr:Sec-independent protein translocase protein TatB [Brevundimonas sp.]MBU3969939.1 Sec-independent protein translocase protein TatB [Alphaproteobacteria bacterium]MBA3049940.1 twin-arginine translocase subunit TatB [Brevundimonas sp.]MBU3974650.1 Sec-independent protein translocase protein TatB [Alphaproteobacteria bacterium]MBU4039878.1 Sec-independent protein translocase protein TatB [Alphaproteobacteria bacterium]MBU4134907.1 Sec-independent protein translocase protein TatB [Alphaproteobac
MGGLGPGIGGFEILVVGIVALLVVGPKDLPLLMRKIGKVMARARAMANEFRSSFDEMARQSELDELRKEVQALRTGQGMVPLGAEADAAFREIRDDLNRPLDEPVMLAAPDEWPDSPPVMAPLEAEPEPAPKAKAKAAPRSRKTPAKTAAAPAASTKTASGKARAIRAKKVDL